MKRIRSNHTEFLVEELAAILARPRPLSEVLRPDVVLVHSHGLGQWLDQQVAHHAGVCANVLFQQPMEFAEHVLAGLDPERKARWTADRLVWALLSALRERLDDAAFGTIRDWSLADGVAWQERRLVDLAMELAPRFERYALYRPDAMGQGTDWQHILWSAVSASLGGGDVGSRIRRLEEEAFTRSLARLPGHVVPFNVGILPPSVIDLLDALSLQVPVTWMSLCVPDVSAPHPLLVSLAGQRRTMESLLAGRVTDEDRFVTPEGDSACVQLQQDLVDGAIGDPGRVVDDSIQFHECAGAWRQVEVLRDRLRECLNEDSDLQPREVVVMTPDIERFGPLVRAALAQSKPPIPFRMADTGLRTRNSVAAALMDALVLLEGRFEVSAVLDLLGRPEVAEKRQLDAGRLEDLRALVGSASIHWGLDQEHRSTVVGQDEAFTWRWGLDRLLLGVATASSQDMLGLSALGQGSPQEHLVGVLVEFVEGLIAFRDPSPRTPADWEARLAKLLGFLVEEGNWKARAVRDQLNALSQDTDTQPPIGLPALRRLIEGRFSLSEPGAGYAAGGVSICALVPLRSVPYQRVFLVGMDEGTFPRTYAEPSFDLLTRDPQLGDRNTRDDDRALLLETLLSARQGLEVFYSSRAPRDAGERSPAVPVAELRDVLDRSFSSGEQVGGRPKPASRALTVEHPLQSWDPSTFENQGADPVACRAAQGLVEGRKAAEPPHRFLEVALGSPALVEVSFHRLLAALKHPIKHFCRRALGLYLEEHGEDVSDVEPLVGPEGGLEGWKFKTACVELLLEGVTPDALQAGLRARGLLPAGTMGELVFETYREEVEAVAVEVAKHLVPPRVARVFRVELDGLAVVGSVPLHAGRIVDWTTSRGTQKHHLKAWLQLLCLCAADKPPTGVTLLHASGTWTHEPLSVADASAHLAPLLQIYGDAFRTALPFTADHGANHLNGRKPPDRPDPYLAFAFGGQSLESAAFVGVPQLPGRSFTELTQVVLGTIPC
jgi:exodeoxyribonuclease V gamma subunit